MFPQFYPVQLQWNCYCKVFGESDTILVQSLSHVQLFVTPRTAAHQASLSFTISWRLLKFVSIESVTLSNHLILCLPCLLMPSIFPSIRVFSSESPMNQTSDLELQVWWWNAAGKGSSLEIRCDVISVFQAGDELGSKLRPRRMQMRGGSREIFRQWNG